MAEMHSLMDSAGHEEAKNEFFGAKESSEKEASLLRNLRRWPGCLSWAALTQLLPLFMFLGLFLFLATILVQVSRLHQPPRGSTEDQQCNRNLANFSQQIQLNMKGIHQLLAQINASLASLCHPCPLGWEHFKGSRYFSRSQKNWEASSAACQDRKAQLVIINSEAEEVQ
ncbi:CD209 antigen-like protein 2 [Erinaceus europaeus]|uniref:CD209 antigen-like protein 2 n=1 Tax=Erinaceus europaeus TaxID=9365 RepID=A0A1S3WNQ2_ERIEU|nr:CD209 antigen-like protein 2 [Erinaceus europaeus]